MLSAEVEKLKQDFNQSEKDKLEAQTRLEVLSNYFKDKENQLQKYGLMIGCYVSIGLF